MTVTWPSPAVAEAPVGGPATVAGVADALEEAGPVPAPLTAFTVKA
jgi:hypothetical protein